MIAGVSLNPDHSVWIGDRVLATSIPAGFWAVKVRPTGDLFTAFATPRKGNTTHPFLIATGDTRDSVLVTAIRWADSASTTVMHPGRVVFAGFGDATEESKPGFDPAELLPVPARWMTEPGS